MSQACWYSSHLRHTDEFYPCIRPGLKKRKQYKPPTSHIVYKPRHSKQENNQFCSMLIASGMTDCFTHCEKSKPKSRGGGVPPVMAYTGKLRPNCERGTFSRLEVYERVRISIVEVYERVERSVSFLGLSRFCSEKAKKLLRNMPKSCSKVAQN